MLFSCTHLLILGIYNYSILLYNNRLVLSIVSTIEYAYKHTKNYTSRIPFIMSDQKLRVPDHPATQPGLNTR